MVIGDPSLDRLLSLLSVLPTQIFPKIQIYGDLINERTEIDSELAFGFLKRCDTD